MGIVAAISNVQTSLPAEAVSQTGIIVTISLAISLSIALLISDSKHWNRWASGTLDICSSPLLITFAGIVAYKIMLII